MVWKSRENWASGWVGARIFLVVQMELRKSLDGCRTETPAWNLPNPAPDLNETLSSEGPGSCHHRRSGDLPYSEDSNSAEGGGESRRQVAAAGAGEDDTPGGEARDAVAEDDVEAHRNQAQDGGQPPPQVPAAHHQPRAGAPAAHPPFPLAVARDTGWIWRLCRCCDSEFCDCLI